MAAEGVHSSGKKEVRFLWKSCYYKKKNLHEIKLGRILESPLGVILKKCVRVKNGW